jgi:hypothetical protein
VSLYAFVDDTGSEPSQPVYVLGGYVAPEDYWPSVANAWGLVLEQNPQIEYFKASQVWDFSKGPFMAFSAHERRSKVDALVGVLSDFNMVAISARLRWDDWQKFKVNRSIEKFAHDPYFFLFYALITSVVQQAHKAGYPGKSLFVFDNHGSIWKKVEAWYPHFYDLLNDRTRAYIALKPCFEDEKEIVPLQAADLFAWHHRKHVLGKLNEWQQSKWILLSKRMNSVVIESGNLVSMAEELGVAS